MELIRRNARTLAVFFALSTAVLSALSRLGGLKSVKNTIWAEDAVIFFSQSIENGLHSLIIPYAGYLHTYNRIVAIISLLFPIGATPFIYFSGWLISSLVLIYAITRVSGSTILASSIAASVAFTLPSNGEIFYSLTNSQWLTGAALAILLTCPGKIARIKLDIPIIALASFSGPFAILITPIMILRIIALRDVRENAFAYSSISAGAITNLIILLCSSRISGQHASASLYDWERAIRIFLTFNYQSKILALASILFFITLAIKVVTEREKQARTQGLLLITSAILIYISSAAQFSPPTVITPTINGGRYFFIPYAISASLIAINFNRRILISIIAVILAITASIPAFKKNDRPDIFWREFAELSSMTSGVKIPVPPKAIGKSDWQTTAIPFNGESFGMPATMSRSENMTCLEGTCRTSGESRTYWPSPSCKGKYTGVKFTSSGLSGISKIFWRKHEIYTEKHSFTRGLRGPESIVTFVFPTSGVDEIRFDPVSGPGQFSVIKAEFFCLGRAR